MLLSLTDATNQFGPNQMTQRLSTSPVAGGVKHDVIWSDAGEGFSRIVYLKTGFNTDWSAIDRFDLRFSATGGSVDVKPFVQTGASFTYFESPAVNIIPGADPVLVSLDFDTVGVTNIQNVRQFGYQVFGPSSGAGSVLVQPADVGWSITPRNTMALSSGPVMSIREFSGVTYLGPADAVGLHRFAAVQDENQRIVSFDVGFTANGSISSATAISPLTLSIAADYEGIAYTGPARNTVFVSEETTPGVHEHSLTTGERLKTVPLSSVFDAQLPNGGLESLARFGSAGQMWIANEKSLTIDGPEATQAAGTFVRLQQLTDNGDSVTAGPQFAYPVDPIHSGTGPQDSGLTDLAVLPDGSLIALERSRITASPQIRSRIYHVDFAGATDISSAAFNNGLVGQNFTPVGKTLLWSGQVGGSNGNNLEGLTVGPRLANGNWVVLGVVDSGSGGGAPIVAFELAVGGNPAAGDFNGDGQVDERDYNLWRATFGSTGAEAAAADANGDGTVDAADYVVWRNSALPSAGQGGTAIGATHSIPEPNAALMLLLAVPWIGSARFESHTAIC